MSFLFELHVSFCHISVSSFLSWDTSSVSEVPLGSFEPLRQTSTVYAMTHAHWFTRSSHSGVGCQGCLIHTHEPWNKRHTHTHTHWCTVSGGCAAPEQESWLFPGRTLVFPQTRPKPKSQNTTTTTHTAQSLRSEGLRLVMCVMKFY